MVILIAPKLSNLKQYSESDNANYTSDFEYWHQSSLSLSLPLFSYVIHKHFECIALQICIST